MNEHLEKTVAAHYKSFGFYDVRFLKTETNKIDLCAFADIKHYRNGTTSHGYSKKVFYDYIPHKDLSEYLEYYFYDTKRERIDKSEIMSEKGLIVIGNIELKRVKKNSGHVVKIYPSFISSKSKFSPAFAQFIKEKSKEIGVNKLYQELTLIKDFKISKSSIYNILKIAK